jgi:hypothetical protein
MLMPSTPPFQNPSAVPDIPKEESKLGERIALMTLIEQRGDQGLEQEERRRREGEEFKEEIANKSIRELMLLQRELQEEAERKASVLKAVKGEDMLAPTAYIRDRHVWESLSLADDDRIIDALRAKHIRTDVIAALNTSFSPVKEAQDPAAQLEETKKWLKDTFPDRPTDALIVRDTIHGGFMVVSLGVSDYETDAAKEIQADKLRAEDKSSQVTTRIQEKIKEGLQSTTTLAADHTVTALATPAKQRESQEFTPTQRT